MKLKRHKGNPILSPNPANEWESLAVFNPGAWYDQDKKQVLLLYRAAEAHPEYKCYFGLATSPDGLHFERVSDRPAAHEGLQKLCPCRAINRSDAGRPGRDTVSR
ncbi:MAG TPA: hypothetical protein VMW24_25180 [Sedimentisphaerales bacterium]|nr:hypothetical protein [Sedimentisphaerales bacterium]